MATKRKELSDLQRDLLQLALQEPKGKIWLPKSSQQAFPTTYAAIVALQRRGLLDAEQGKNPEVLTWKVTKEGRDTLKEAKAAESALVQAPTPAATPQRVMVPTTTAANKILNSAPSRPQSSGAAERAAKPAPTTKPSPAPKPASATKPVSATKPAPATKPGKAAHAAPIASVGSSREKGSKGTDSVVPAKSGRSLRSAPPAKPEAPRDRGSKGKAASAAPASRGAAAKKAVAAPKKSGGRGRT